jgi:putative spermidine/putrescine transport system permease protein
LPGIFSGAAFSFVTSWDEVVVVLFITSRQVTTLPVVIWTSLTERVDPAVAAISVVMIVATLAAVLVRLASSRS